MKHSKQISYFFINFPELYSYPWSGPTSRMCQLITITVPQLNHISITLQMCTCLVIGMCPSDSCQSHYKCAQPMCPKCSWLPNSNHISDIHNHCFLNVPTDNMPTSFHMFLQFSVLGTFYSKEAHIENVSSNTRLIPSCVHPKCSPNVLAMFLVVHSSRYIPTQSQLQMSVLGWSCARVCVAVDLSVGLRLGLGLGSRLG